MEKQDTSGNVILFPKWKDTLEEESLQALKEKRYEEALTKLNKLISYQAESYEIIVGKMMCLMELGYYQEAQDICELEMQKKDEHYYHFIHMYVTILFQTHQYDLLLEQAGYELASDSLPPELREQLQQLYHLSENMRNDIAEKENQAYLADFQEAVKKMDHRKQWRLVENLRKRKETPPAEMADCLISSDIHPVTKTAIFNWLKNSGSIAETSVHKMDQYLSITPASAPDLWDNETNRQILAHISLWEQENPTLFQLMEKLLYRYTYVFYPILPPAGDAEKIAEALAQIAAAYMNLYTTVTETNDPSVGSYMETIQLCEALYLGIIED
ncbi:tetratricopeptide repeat protein [Lentibacillus sediminis]|uniref:tetratricopeptide repeat protein n=1 Tax=Lentibacillus sediminis TaxID=1940529 RepID=UPI000C1BF741|nr:tetratricopeptide repeat protein [Lentibacillus sediminis]